MAGYNRNDTTNNIATGNIINASDLDGEFDAIDAAFDETTGHVHDGTSGNGAPITKVGPVQDLVVSASTVTPKTTATLDLGTPSLKFKDLNLSGNALVAGTLGVTGNTTLAGALISDNITDSTSTITGAVQTDGGLGVAKALWVGGLANIAGATTLQGTLGVTGVATLTAKPILSSLTASQAVFSDATKGLVSNAITGTGNVVMSASPTLTGTAAGASLSLSSLTATRVTYAGTAGLLQDSANLTFNGTTLTSTGFAGPISGVVTSTSITDSALTSGRVTYAGTGGLLQDDADLTFDGSTLTTLNSAYTGTLTGGTGVVNLGSGQFYKDASGNVGIGTSSPANIGAGYTHLEVNGSTSGLVSISASGVRGLSLSADGSVASVQARVSGQPLVFFTNNAGTVAERMRITSAGDVFINGTTAAVLGYEKFSVNGSGSFKTSSGAALGLWNTGTSGLITFYTDTGTLGGSVSAISGVLTISAGTTLNLVSAGANPMTFGTNGSERMRIDSSGNVGIGTSSPVSKLHVYGSGATLTSSGTDDRAFGTNTFATISNPNIAVAYTVNGTTKDIAGLGYDYTNGILGIVNNNQYTGGGKIAFYTGDKTSTTGNLLERMRIDSSGGLRINTTAYIANSGEKLTVTTAGDTSFFQSTGGNGTGTALHVNRNGGTGNFLYFTYGAGFSAVGSINTNGTSTTYSTSSDYRLKENIAPMQGALDTVAQLKPVTYNWKADGSSGQGFIAHELQAVVPDCVTGEKDAVDAEGKPVYQGIDTSFLVATLAKAIQELKAEVDSLKQQIGK